MEALLISTGGALGAVLRYSISQLLNDSVFPWSTLVVNAVGSFVLAIVLFAGTNSELEVLVGVGFCGAFTTFSSFSYQTVSLWERGKRRHAILNAVGNIVISLTAFAGAWILVT
jgi:CrcB protein